MLSSLSAQSCGYRFYLFHMFGIHVLSELSFHTNPLFSFRLHIDSEISLFACSGYKWFFLRKKSLIYSFHVWIIKFTKKTLSLVSATSDSFMPLLAHGVINCICFTCSGYMCYRNCPFHCSHLIFLLGCIFIQKYLFHLFGKQD